MWHVCFLILCLKAKYVRGKILKIKARNVFVRGNLIFIVSPLVSLVIKGVEI